MPRTIVVGDVHGCLQELEDLVRLLEYHPGKDRLVLMGDLVDRGPAPVECVRWAMKNKITSVRGNHEAKLVDFRRKEAIAVAGGPANSMQRPFPDRLAEWMAFSEAELVWMENMPLWVDLGGGWTAVHAGFEPKPMPEQKADRVMRVRYVDEKTGEFVGMKRVPIEEVEAEAKPARPHISGNRPMTPEALALRAKRQAERLAKGLPSVVEQPRRKVKRYTTSYEQPERSKPWQAMWPGPQKVIYGHAAQKGSPLVETNAHGIMTVGVDTACVYGFRLTAAIMVDGNIREFAHVNAEREYYPWPVANQE